MRSTGWTAYTTTAFNNGAANGNVTSVTNVPTGSSTSYTYDNNNRLTQQTEGSSNQINYGYDPNSNLESLSFTAGTTTVSTGYNYNPLNQLISMSRNGTNQAKFVYDERGNVISVSYSNGTYTAFEFDDANRLSSLKNYLADGTLLDSYSYTYDANNNRTSVTTTAGTVSYQYDDLNQLTQETLLDGTTMAYTYDAAGNRTTKTVTQGGIPTTTNYTYDAANELTAVNGQAYTYDANGNLTNNGAKTFIYDVENRLTEVKDASNQTIATFTYDHEGKRTSMTTASGTIYFHYVGDKVIYETDGSNSIVAEYTWDAQGHPVTMTRGGATYYYHINGHGDVTALTDASGNMVAQYQYDAWGNITFSTGSMKDANPYRYAGYRYDEVTGLYYLMARYYDASVGRFITRDTFHGFENDPLSLNQYAYAKNNPVIYVDPDGHFAAAAGIYFVPGIGEIALLATGAVILAGITFMAGSWIVHKVRAYFSERPNKTAQEIISSEKKGSINKEFPGSMKNKTLKEIEQLARQGNREAQKAKKLLNDKRFDKGDNRK